MRLEHVFGDFNVMAPIQIKQAGVAFKDASRCQEGLPPAKLHPAGPGSFNPKLDLIAVCPKTNR